MKADSIKLCLGPITLPYATAMPVYIDQNATLISCNDTGSYYYSKRLHRRHRRQSFYIIAHRRIFMRRSVKDYTGQIAAHGFPERLIVAFPCDGILRTTSVKRSHTNPLLWRVHRRCCDGSFKHKTTTQPEGSDRIMARSEMPRIRRIL